MAAAGCPAPAQSTCRLSRKHSGSPYFQINIRIPTPTPFYGIAKSTGDLPGMAPVRYTPAGKLVALFQFNKMDNLSQWQLKPTSNIFSSRLIDSKNLYLYQFGRLPNIAYIGNVDGEKAYTQFIQAYKTLIEHTHLYRSYYTNNSNTIFDETVLLLANGCIISFDTYYCEILYPDTQMDFTDAVVKLISPVKRPARREPAEINLIVRGRNGGLELKAMEIKRTRLDISLFYEDDFYPVHQLISRRLRRKGDKGIVLLHGLPGAGKTTYLRYLIGKSKKTVLFLSPSAAGNLMDPGLIEILIDHPDSILVIEDAENIIMDRKVSNDPSVSNLLNISDGLLSDFLNVQLVCTFNSSLTLIDSALMRKGRLIARYEFGKLGVEKARRLSHHLGYDQVINQPMTIAEICNQHESSNNGYESGSIRVAGFRRDAVAQN